MATRLCWLGHACLLVETDGHKLLFDPFLTGNPTAPVKASDVSPDFLLVSHGHGDHIGDAIAIGQRTLAPVICNYEISEWLERKGVKAHGMQHGGGFRFPFGRCKLTLAFHGSMLPDGSNGGNPCGFYLTFNDGTSETLNLPINVNGGTTYYAFTDTASFSSITITNLSNDAWGIDDVRYGAGTSSAPEPSSLMLLGSGVVALAGVLRRKFIQ